MDVDFSDLDKLAADLTDAPDTLPKHLRKALEVTAKRVKDDARKSVGARKYFKGGASAIDYELTGFSGVVSGMDAEIGYNKGRRAGRLGNLIEFGAPRSNNSLPPGGELQKALAGNREDFERGILAAVDDALREVNL